MDRLKICHPDELVEVRTNYRGCDCASGNNPDFIYTGGFLHLNTGQGGYGIYSSGLHLNIAKPYPYADHRNNLFTLQLKAIHDAMIYVKSHQKSRHRVDIFTDCEKVLNYLENLQNNQPSPDIDSDVGASILKEIEEGGWFTEVWLHKVNGHSGITGNKMAQQIAKTGAKKAPKLELSRDQQGVPHSTSIPSSGAVLCGDWSDLYFSNTAS